MLKPVEIHKTYPHISRTALASGKIANLYHKKTRKDRMGMSRVYKVKNSESNRSSK